VLDASAVVRALVDHDPEALDWLGRIARDEVRAACPDLLYAQVADAVLVRHRAGGLTRSQAQDVIDAAVTAPFAAEPLGALAAPAWSVAKERGLSVYDACYVVLAETMDAALITADRHLASTTANAVLLPEAT
jgi:predicted nucleic acid-binding protein